MKHGRENPGGRHSMFLWQGIGWFRGNKPTSMVEFTSDVAQALKLLTAQSSYAHATSHRRHHRSLDIGIEEFLHG
jgi:hypothetical protein